MIRRLLTLALLALLVPGPAAGAKPSARARAKSPPKSAAAKPAPKREAPLPAPPPLAAALRVTIFLEAGFPAVDAPPPDRDALRTALVGAAVRFVGLDSLAAALDSARTDVCVLPYGSAFPAAAWPALRGFLAAGGGWVNLGGAPLAVPVVREGSGWQAQARTIAYHRAIGVVQAEAVEVAKARFAAAGAWAALPPPRGLDKMPGRSFQELSVRLTARRLHPGEDGSDGPRDAVLTPCLHVFARGQDLPAAAALVRLDHFGDDWTGGCWLFATGDGELPSDVVRRAAAEAGGGALAVRAQASPAVLRPGETPTIAVTVARPRPAHGGAVAGNCTLVLRAAGTDKVLGQATVALTRDATGLAARVKGPKGWPAKLPPGLYTVQARVTVGGPGASRAATGEGGFLVSPSTALGGGPLLAVDGGVFTLNGAPFPVVGTTYMDSQVHRRFLLEPDPARWDRDFALMQAAGVNLVRTGIWTGWDEHCEPGGSVPREEVLRGLEAFLLTARAHGMPVIFTFFAFTPPLWGGTNPYLDPVAVAAQREFVGAFARRFAGARDVAWDLINEPSFSSPEHLWQCRPNGDAAEQAAWTAWLRALAPGAVDAGLAPAAADRWGITVGDPVTLPTPDDFADRNLFGEARPRRAADYRRFAQDAFAGWVRHLRDAIRATGGGDQLVTVGQDEGGLRDRPGPLFFGPELSFTCIHSWWLNDDLLWDGLLARLPDRPLLVEETGLMTSERSDGSAWRTGQQNAELLTRKLALAFAAGGAGLVQWCWNSNPYMPSDNEAGIGLLRVDGTAKPELAAFTAVADFARRNAAALGGMEESEGALLVVPHSQIFSGRDLGSEATQRAVRVLEYDLGIPVRVMAEHAVAAMTGTPQLIVLPSPRLLRQDAWESLLRAVERGAVLCVSGPFDRDECERPVDRSGALGAPATVRPVAPWEGIELDGRVVRAGFRGARLERAETAVIDGDAAAVHVLERGEGTWLWSPVPVELADATQPTVALYVAAATRAQLSTLVTREEPDPTLLVRPVVYKDVVLVCLVNEGAAEKAARFSLRGARTRVSQLVPPQSAVILLLDRATGRVLDRSTDLPAK